jgi:hypothetical protein
VLPILLADNGIASQTLRILLDSKLRGFSGTNLQHSSPLGKPGTSLIVLLAPLSKTVVALGGGLYISSG